MQCLLKYLSVHFVHASFYFHAKSVFIMAYLTSLSFDLCDLKEKFLRGIRYLF